MLRVFVLMSSSPSAGFFHGHEDSGASAFVAGVGEDRDLFQGNTATGADRQARPACAMGREMTPVADRGLLSAKKRRFLQQGASACIIGEKLRSESRTSRPPCPGRPVTSAWPGTCRSRKPHRGRGRPVRHPLQPRRRGPRRCGPRRAHPQLEETIARSGKLTATKRAELRGKISTMPGLNRFLRVTPAGLLRIDKTKAKAEENLDGKYLLRCADPKMSTEDIAARLQAAAGSRARLAGHEIRPGPAAGLPPARRTNPRPRHPVLARPAAHPGRREPGRADLAEDPPRARPHPHRHLHRPAGTFRQLTDLSQPARDLLATLNIAEPRKIYQLTTPSGLTHAPSHEPRAYRNAPRPPDHAVSHSGQQPTL